MTGQGVFDFEREARTADLLESVINRSDRILVKKLSNNDRDWARYANKHQAGVYIPADERDGGFFPSLVEKDRGGAGGKPIREAWFTTFWPQARDAERQSRLVHYTSKGPETHMTRLPKEPFADLLPASFLVMGRVVRGGGQIYECLTVDSGSDEAGLLAEVLDIGPDFHVAEFDPAERRARERERVLDFAEQVIMAWKRGEIAEFARDHAAMPATFELARRARAAFLEKHELDTLDPFRMEAPGDALREISREIEWELFKEFQRRERSVDLVRIVMGDEGKLVETAGVIRRLVEELPRVDALMLSAAQQRKSRAGYSYEHHIEAMLQGGRIPFEKQVVIEARKRPDFILPSLAFVNGGSQHAGTGLILSAKTTLRERWKQVEREKGTRRLYLTTVDENIAGNAIEDMASIGVHLVIPESLKKAKETEYDGHANVQTFQELCSDVVGPSMDWWSDHYGRRI
ncbi:hypothetical protein OCH239_18640 [Roseivivax halodurans JCM 10272]|uniref:Restriction endonuclease type II EcoRII C-terminal domain-containing protein n=1 Tax=Roseivivax halodurans JCM 10272 TaxID=1449350 RepID=X7E9Y1_9RHOB|nr:type II restriction endonuclease [Roseivivax halodurans]ETX12011.1 hypothetical protein OCH239_18640 [Roseivivax halodurans JCM 10272]